MITIKNVNKEFDGFRALDDLTMTIPTGSIYGLIGTNGSGKTTIIKHMAGILRPDSGTIEYDGAPVWENADLKAQIALIPDELYFPNGYTLDQMAGMYAGIYPSWNQQRFAEMTEAFGLPMRGSGDATGHTRLRSFSKGMKKQAAFCLAMSAMPKYLLLDEPIDGLDPLVRKLVWKYIVEDVADRETTVLVSSHNLREMEGICNQVGILSHGHLLSEREIDTMTDSLEEVFLREMGGENNEISKLLF